MLGSGTLGIMLPTSLILNIVLELRGIDREYGKR